MEELGENLKKWLKRKFFAILVVFILTAADLAIIRIKMWLVLAFLVGLLNFTPINNDFDAGVIYKKSGQLIRGAFFASSIKQTSLIQKI